MMTMWMDVGWVWLVVECSERSERSATGLGVKSKEYRVGSGKMMCNDKAIQK